VTDRAGLGLPEPKGFPNCLSCAFLVNGPVRVCTRCAAKTLTPIADDHCEVCSQALGASGKCTNRICNDPNRAIESVAAVAVYTDPLRGLIFRLKENPSSHWGLIFGRLVFGWLRRNRSPLDFDLIIPNPTFRREGDIGHTEAVLRHAWREDAWDDFNIVHPDEPVMIKTSETTKSKSTSFAPKIQAAEAHAAALEFPNGLESVLDARILVYDDVLTTGAQLDTVARLLKEHGAASVTGLVLARVPWRY
jgi:predicted amidophosphoribosyltransferase